MYNIFCMIHDILFILYVIVVCNCNTEERFPAPTWSMEQLRRAPPPPCRRLIKPDDLAGSSRRRCWLRRRTRTRRSSAAPVGSAERQASYPWPPFLLVQHTRNSARSSSGSCQEAAATAMKFSGLVLAGQRLKIGTRDRRGRGGVGREGGSLGPQKRMM